MLVLNMLKIDCYFIREKIDSKELVLPYVKSEDQVADMTTRQKQV